MHSVSSASVPACGTHLNFPGRRKLAIATGSEVLLGRGADSDLCFEGDLEGILVHDGWSLADELKRLLFEAVSTSQSNTDSFESAQG